jgi:undecaprenyl phosphate-alpha-L-ara4N flippase subunit ArnE
MFIAYGLVGLTIVFTVLGQYFQKLAADQLLADWAPASLLDYLRCLFDRRVLSALFCLSIAMLFWLLALQRLAVSLAYPLLAVNYVAMMLLARWRFHEVIPSVRWLGVLSILAGIVMITGA